MPIDRMEFWAGTATPALDDLNDGVLEALGRQLREAQELLPWVGLKHFRDSWLPDFLTRNGIEDGEAIRSRAIARAVEAGIIREVSVPNPTNSEFPTTALEVIDSD